MSQQALQHALPPNKVSASHATASAHSTSRPAGAAVQKLRAVPFCCAALPAHAPMHKASHLVLNTDRGKHRFTSAQLVYLINEDQGVGCACRLQALRHLARHGSHIRAPVACRKQGAKGLVILSALRGPASRGRTPCFAATFFDRGPLELANLSALTHSKSRTAVSFASGCWKKVSRCLMSPWALSHLPGRSQYILALYIAGSRVLDTGVPTQTWAT